MKRRAALVLTGAGLAAGAAGLAWQRRQEALLHAATGGIWQAEFPQLDGTPLRMASLRGRPLVLNFWGTWCPPCVREMPELDRFQREFGPLGWQVLGLAVDNPRAVREYLQRSPVGYRIAMAGFEGSELTRRLGNTQGGLPFTVLFGSDGAAVQRRLGETHFDELAAWAEAV